MQRRASSTGITTVCSASRFRLQVARTRTAVQEPIGVGAGVGADGVITLCSGDAGEAGDRLTGAGAARSHPATSNATAAQATSNPGHDRLDTVLTTRGQTLRPDYVSAFRMRYPVKPGEPQCHALSHDGAATKPGDEPVASGTGQA